MKKYAVVSYYDGNIELDTIKDTYEEAKQWMDEDVREFVEPADLDSLLDNECWINNNSAYANIDGWNPCDWKILEIDI